MKIIINTIISENTGEAFIVKKGEHIRIMGKTIVDFVAFRLDNLRERFDQARTRANQLKIFITKGDKLISKLNNGMFTIVEDTYREGTHDLLFGACSGSSYKLRAQLSPNELWRIFGREVRPEEIPDHGCWENLSMALEKWNVAPEDIPSPFNIFMTIKVDGFTGKLYHTNIRPSDSAYVELRAEMDCLTAVSVCPDISGGGGRPISVTIYDSNEKGQSQN